MKETKTQKGITLVALIITIIILLILAGVAIATIQESDIIKKAQDATKTYKEKEEEEPRILKSYSDFISAETDPIAKALKGWIFNQTTEEELVKVLKKDASIENEDILLNELMIFLECDGGWGIYLYESDKFYKMEPIEKDGEVVDVNVSCAEKTQYANQYKKGKTLKEIMAELENVFAGKTLSDIEKEISDNAIEGTGAVGIQNLLLYKSEKITASTIYITDTQKIRFDSITWKDGEYELAISDEDAPPITGWVVPGDDGVYYKAYMDNSE